MNINIYSIYTVKFVGNDSFLSEENETIYDKIYKENKYECKCIISGKDLLDVFHKNLADSNISEFKIINRCFQFIFFNDTNGEASVKEYTILEVE